MGMDLQSRDSKHPWGRGGLFLSFIVHLDGSRSENLVQSKIYDLTGLVMT